MRQDETGAGEAPEPETEAEEFAREVEEDPSTATSGDDELEEVRGG